MTPRENLLMFMNHEIPAWIPNYRKDAFVYTPPETLDRSADRNGGLDWFGVKWAFEPTIRGFMPDTRCEPFLDDITEWEQKVKFPDLNAIDWAAMVQRDSHLFDENKVTVMQIVCGLFERLAALMGMMNANIALVEEPDACREFFLALADFRIQEMDKLITWFPQIDMFEMHDDWGTQASTFMSPATWCDVIAPAVSKIEAFIKSKNKHLHIHSCGRVERLIPYMIDAGIDHWTSAQSMNDLPGILHKYCSTRKFTMMGGFDIPQWREPGMTKEILMPLVEERIDQLCKGGACLPYVALRVPHVNDCICEALEKRKDYYSIPENREFV